MSEEPQRLVNVIEDNILVATFNRSARLNAISIELTPNLEDAAERFLDTPGLRVILVMAKGPCFLRGTDLMQDGLARECPTRGSNVREQHRRLPSGMRCVLDEIEGIEEPIAVSDQMMAQGFGHIITISSIYRNRPMAGAAVYGTIKAAVAPFSHASRQRARGKINFTGIKPPGVMARGGPAPWSTPPRACGWSATTWRRSIRTSPTSRRANPRAR